MKIRSAEEKDLKDIRYLWHDCFSDPYEYIDFFLKNRFQSKFCAILEKDREVVGMIHLLPCTIYPNTKALYWYAAGIRSDKRNQGLFKKFAEYVKEKANALGFQNLCVPARGLEEYYQALGFKFSYTSEDIVFEREMEEAEKNPINLEEGSARDFIEFVSPTDGDTVWNEEAIQYAIQENLNCGGKVFRLQTDEKRFCFFAIKKDDAFLIDYHNISTEEFKMIKDAIFLKLNCEKLIFRANGNEKIVGLTDASMVGINSKITMTLA